MQVRGGGKRGLGWEWEVGLILMREGDGSNRGNKRITAEEKT